MEQLFEQARNGDRQAEQEIFTKLLVRFRYLAKRRIGEADSEDIAQEACVTVLEKYKTESITVGFAPWAFGVLKMKIGNHLQRSKRRRDKEAAFDESLHSKGPGPAAPNFRRHLIECITEVSRSFPRYARILNLNHLGFRTAEICDRLNITDNHYYVSLNRGRAILKECLRRKGSM